MNLRVGTLHASGVVETIADAVVAQLDADPLIIRRFVRRYFAETDGPDLEARPVAELAAVVVAHWRLGAELRAPLAVEVTSIDGPAGPLTVVASVVDDMPFLVDSIHAVITRHHLGIHLTVHPMLEVRRDAEGRIADIGGRDGVLEAWTMILVDACPAERIAALEAEVAAALNDVRRAAADREPMRRRALQLAADVALSSHPQGESAAEFLTWLTRQRFIFLGAARYTRVADGLEPVDGTGLGSLAEPHQPDPPPFDAPELITVLRTDAHATVHRSSRMTCVVVRRFGPGGEIVGEDRLVGLFAAAAYRESATETPLLRVKADEVLSRTGFPNESHAGRAVRAALEQIPRDELFEIATDDLYELTMGIVGLQERHLVRVFAVPEPGNRYVLCLVYFPRSRFSPTSAERIAELVRAAFDGSSVEHDTVVGASALARIDLIIRRRPGSEEQPDIAALEAAIDALTTDWSERLAAELGAAIGPAQATDLLDRLGRGIPVAYRAVTDPAEAVTDLVAIGSLRAQGEAGTVLRPRRGGSPGELRFDLYRRGGEPTTLSAVLPYLEHLGVVVVDQRPFEFSVPPGDNAPVDAVDDTVWMSEIGIRLPDGTELDEQRSAEFQRSFLAMLRGEIENDGFNRLVVTAGLTSRQIAVLRAYAKYTRQISFGHSQSAIESMLVRWPAVARLLVALFERRFDPAPNDDRETEVAALAAELSQALDRVPSLDDDRIGRELQALIAATLRTNAFRRSAQAVRRRCSRSSSIRRWSPTSPRRARCSRSSSAHRESKGCTCVVGGSPAAGCAGATAGRTSAPRCSV